MRLTIYLDSEQRGIINSKKRISAFNFEAALELNGGDILEQENFLEPLKSHQREPYFFILTGGFSQAFLFLEASALRQESTFATGLGADFNSSEPQLSYL